MLCPQRASTEGVSRWERSNVRKHGNNNATPTTSHNQSDDPLMPYYCTCSLQRDALGSTIGAGGADGGVVGAGEAGSGSGSGAGSSSGGGAGRNRGLGPSLDSEQAAKLLVLMCHARTCPGNHRSPRLAEVGFCFIFRFFFIYILIAGFFFVALVGFVCWCRCLSVFVTVVGLA